MNCSDGVGDVMKCYDCVGVPVKICVCDAVNRCDVVDLINWCDFFGALMKFCDVFGDPLNHSDGVPCNRCVFVTR